jgi:hypothetical protein
MSDVAPALPSPKRLTLLAALIIMSLLALWAGVVWLRDHSVEVPKYKRDPRYATQTRSRDAVEKAYLRWGGGDVRDKAAAACEAHTVAGWAAVLGTPVNAKAVSRALSVSVDPAFRHAAYLGCMDELALVQP